MPSSIDRSDISDVETNFLTSEASVPKSNDEPCRDYFSRLRLYVKDQLQDHLRVNYRNEWQT